MTYKIMADGFEVGRIDDGELLTPNAVENALRDFAQTRGMESHYTLRLERA